MRSLQGATARLRTVNASTAPSFYVDARLHGRPVVLFVDTGSPHSFIAGGGKGPTDVNLGGHTVVLPRNVHAGGYQMVDGRPAVGTIGADLLLGPGESVILDPSAGRIEWRGLDAAERQSAWTRVSLERVKDGTYYAKVRVNGVPRALELDTGTSDTLLTQKPPPGASPVTTINWEGKKVRMFWGKATLGFGAKAPETVGALFSRSGPWSGFPQYQRSMDRSAAGLLGLSSLGHGRLAFVNGSQLLFEPGNA